MGSYVRLSPRAPAIKRRPCSGHKVQNSEEGEKRNFGSRCKALLLLLGAAAPYPDGNWGGISEGKERRGEGTLIREVGESLTRRTAPGPRVRHLYADRICCLGPTLDKKGTLSARLSDSLSLLF